MAEANTPVTETNQNMAENSGGDPKGNAENADAVSTNEGAEKTFTQKELDEQIKKRLERERKNIFRTNSEFQLTRPRGARPYILCKRDVPILWADFILQNQMNLLTLYLYSSISELRTS